MAMTANDYNAKMSGVLWTVENLPAWLRGLAVSSDEFTAAVENFQTAQKDLGVPDGKLGPLTWARLYATCQQPPIPCVQTPSARQENRRMLSWIHGFGIHTTGYGVAQAAYKYGGGVDKELRVIRNLMSDPNGYFSHGAILTDGSYCVCCTANEIAIHGGYPQADVTAYATGNWLKQGNFKWWTDRWDPQGITNPRDLCSSPNTNLYAIDLVPIFGQSSDTFTDAQYATLNKIIAWASETFGFPIDRKHILGHEDFAPIQRPHSCPGPYFDWSKVNFQA